LGIDLSIVLYDDGVDVKLADVGQEIVGRFEIEGC